jgi:hypothetical protein
MVGRKGKISYAARMKGVGKKAMSRRRRKCPLTQVHKDDAANAFAAAATIADISSALTQVLQDRTSGIFKNIFY